MSSLREEIAQTRLLMNVFHTNNIRSVSMAAMLVGLGNDKVGRLLTRAEELAGGELTQVRDNRIVLTPHVGQPFREWLEELHFRQQLQADRIEELRIVIRPGVDPGILATAIATATRSYDHIALRVGIQPEGMQEAVDSGFFTFGVTFTDGKTAESCELIEPAIPASILIPRNHRLFGAEGQIDADHFATKDIVFMASGMEACFNGLLHRVQPANRVEIGCPETLRRLIADGHGLGVVFAHPSQSPDVSLTCLPIVGIEPIWLGLVFPRKRDLTDEPATMFLIEAIRKAVRDAALPEIPALVDVPEEPESLPEIPLPEPLPA